MDRHVVTKQRSPSIKQIILGIKEALELEPGDPQLQRALDYWERRKLGIRTQRRLRLKEIGLLVAE